MNKMPVIWLEYLKFLMEQKKVTQTRRTFDRALCALPITQHDRIWKLYINFIETLNVKETSVKVYKRYIQLEPQAREDYVDFLVSVMHYDEAVYQLAIIVNDDSFISRKKQSKHAMWMKLCDLCSKHPLAVKSVNPEQIIRSGIRKYPDETGKCNSEIIFKWFCFYWVCGLSSLMFGSFITFFFRHRSPLVQARRLLHS